jgi:hypothetical protein
MIYATGRNLGMEDVYERALGGDGDPRGRQLSKHQGTSRISANWVSA